MASRCITNCKSIVIPSLPLSLHVECPICQIQASTILWSVKNEDLSNGLTEAITLDGIATDGM